MESILDATTNNNGHDIVNHTNGHNNKEDGTLLNIPGHNNDTTSVNDDSYYDYEDDEDQEMKDKCDDPTVSILKKKSRPPVLHTDL